METVSGGPAAAYRRELYVALLFMVLTNVFWGAYFPAIKSLYLLIDFPSIEQGDHLWPSIASTLAFVSARFFFGLLLFAILFPSIIRSISGRTFRAGLALGAVFTTGIICQLLGLRLIPASRSALITSLTVLTTPWVAAILFRKWPTKRLFAACVVSFIGAAILVEFVRWNESGLQFDLSGIGLGDLVTFAGTICFSFAICQIDAFNRDGIKGELTPGMFVGAIAISLLGCLLVGIFNSPLYADTARQGVAAFPFEGFTEYTTIFGTPRAVVLFFLIVVFPTVLSFYWMNRYQGFFSPGHAALVYMLEPLSAALWSLWLPGWLSARLSINYPSEHLTWSLLIGGAFILISNLIPALEE